MSSKSLVSVGFIAGRFNVDPREVCKALVDLGFTPALVVNGLKLYDVDEAQQAVVLVMSPELSNPPEGLATIHGDPCGPVEFSDGDDEPGNDGDDDEPSPAPRFDMLRMTERN